MRNSVFNRSYLLIALAVGLTAPAPARSETSRRVYSTDHRLFAFAKDGPLVVGAGEGERRYGPETIFIGDTKSGKYHALVKAGKKVIIPHFASGEAIIENVEFLCFSNDGTELYFLSSAWATSSALIAVNLRTSKVRFVCDANALTPVRTGKWKGNFIVDKHRYKAEGGSSNWQYVVSPNGKELALYKKNSKW